MCRSRNGKDEIIRLAYDKVLKTRVTISPVEYTLKQSKGDQILLLFTPSMQG